MQAIVMNQHSIHLPDPPSSKHFWRIKTSVFHQSTAVQLRRRIGRFSVAVATEYLIAVSVRSLPNVAYDAALRILQKRSQNRSQKRQREQQYFNDKYDRLASLKTYNGDYS
ncbi:hypothetical protein A6F49_04700 [Enteractinococcus helveticum]|uniref:Uncharacterized protein n=1 Tax=Enteractinococcus helveticum TaxID=1837282 RepID=A0A1B7M2Q5_9MICC|nr:hypothetical protein A6F49_04700 [Enteractinococcus helveticum]